MNDIDYKAIAREQIPGESPTGVDIRYSDDFEWLIKENSKLLKPKLVVVNGESKFVYENVNWEKVVKTCLDILQNKSKDLRLLSWITSGLTQTNGPIGFLNSLILCDQLLLNHWENLFPAGESAKISALEQLFNSINNFFGTKSDVKLQFTIEDKNNIEEALSRVDSIRNFITGKNIDNHITFNETQNILTTKLNKINLLLEERNSPPPPPPPPPINPSPSVTDNTVNAPLSPPVSSPPTESAEFDFSKQSDTFKYFRELKTNALKLHKVALENKSSDPIPYKWLRMIYWCPVGFDDKTPYIPMNGPNQLLLDSLQNLSDQGEWESLFFKAEDNFRNYYYNFDIQKFIIQALDNLGGKYLFIKNAVEDELRFLLTRKPFFVNLIMQDRSHLASSETKEWLEVHLGKQPGQAVSDTLNVSYESDTNQSDSIQFDYSAELKDNLIIVREKLRECVGVREGFVCQMQLIEYLIKKKEMMLAFEYLKNLEEQVVKFKIEQWEPKLAVTMLVMLYNCLNYMIQKKKHPEANLNGQLSDTIQRIISLDPIIGADLIKNR